jgi:tetratricopeptide (TPR) repeat protein
MLKLLIAIMFFLTSTQMSFAAGGGGSSSSSGSDSGSYSNSMSEPQGPFAKAYQLIASKKYVEAYKELKSVDAPNKRDDLNNLLGFTARKSGNLEAAAKYYDKALEINPKHVGALQYQGELFITLGEIEKAKQNLEKIGKLCWLFPCSEEKLLETAIEKKIGS